MQPIGVFGGTFDPVHCGHLRTAFELWQELRLAEVRFVPTGSPPHRAQLYASPERRLQMVQAAVADQPSFVVDDREVRRSGMSYSVDTLTELFASSSWFTFIVLQLACLVFSAWLVTRHKITVGDAVMYQTYFGMLIGAVQQTLGV